MRKTFLIIVSILGLCIATLIFVYSIVWLAFDEFFERPDNIRYTAVASQTSMYIVFFIILYRNESFLLI